MRLSWKKSVTYKKKHVQSIALDFYEEKIIMDKNLTIFYVNCDQEKDNKYCKHAAAIV